MRNISLLTARAFATVFLFFGLLTPHHMHPWRSAFQEYGVLFSLLFFSVSLAIENKKLRLPSAKWTALVLILGLCSLLATGLGNPFQLESHYLFFVFVAGIYIAVTAGIASAGNANIVKVFSTILCVAAASQIAVSTAQWAGSVTTISFDNWWSTSGASGGRANGNIFQSNNYGTLVIWGYLAWLYLVSERESSQGGQKFSRFTLTLVAIYFSFGLALGQSRTSILSLIVITLLGFLQVRRFNLSIRVAWLVFLAGTAISWYLQPAIGNIWLSDDLGLESRPFISSDLRFPAWSMFLGAASDSIIHLLFGRGWGTIAATHSYVAGSSSDLPDLGFMVFAHTHNIFLDVLVSFGLLGLLLLAVLLWRPLINLLAQRTGDGRFFLWGMLIALFVHANLELPHWYGYFIWPAGFIAGLLMSPSGNLFVQRQFAMPILIIALGFTGMTFRQYIEFEKIFSNYAIQLARQGRITEVADVGSAVFPGLTESLEVAVIPISEKLTSDDFQRLSRAAIFKPSSFNTKRAYYAAAFLKDVQQYEFFSRLACRMSGYEFASQIHAVSLTIPVSMTRREIGLDCNIVSTTK